MDIEVNIRKYDEGRTDSLVNISNGISDPESRLSYINLIYKGSMIPYEQDLEPKFLFKKVFGRQQSCITYTHRNWVWVFSRNNVQINCLISTRGISWEYDTRNPDIEGLTSLFDSILSAIEGRLLF